MESHSSVSRVAPVLEPVERSSRRLCSTLRVGSMVTCQPAGRSSMPDGTHWTDGADDRLEVGFRSVVPVASNRGRAVPLNRIGVHDLLWLTPHRFKNRGHPRGEARKGFRGHRGRRTPLVQGAVYRQPCRIRTRFSEISGHLPDVAGKPPSPRYTEKIRLSLLTAVVWCLQSPNRLGDRVLLGGEGDERDSAQRTRAGDSQSALGPGAGERARRAPAQVPER